MEINYEQLVIGLLLKFGSVDVDDISVLMDMVKIDNFSSINESDLSRYMRKNNNKVEFDMNMIKRNFECIDEFYPIVEIYQGDVLKKYLENLNLLEFVLRKIRILGKVSVDSYDDNFSNMQIFVVNELKRQGYLMDCVNESDSHCKVTKLTKRGNLYLFLIDNKNVVDKFSRKLRNAGYNDALLQAFLIVQDLERDIEYIEKNIITIDNFLEFCSLYDIDPYMCDAKKDGHTRIRTTKK